LRVASIIPTSMYVMATTVNAAEAEGDDSLLAKTVSSRGCDLTPGHTMPQAGQASRDLVSRKSGNRRVCLEDFTGCKKGG